MNANNNTQKPKYKLLIGLAITLLVCLWIGWGDFNPYVAQEVVRANIRSSIQGVIQISVQYIVPIAILVFFTSEFFNSLPLGQHRFFTNRNDYDKGL
jgi:hypothetical protein